MITEQKKLFVDALLCGYSNRQSAIYAGYGEKSAASKGAQLAKNPEVIQYLAARRSLISAGELAEPVVDLDQKPEVARIANEERLQQKRAGQGSKGGRPSAASKAKENKETEDDETYWANKMRERRVSEREHVEMITGEKIEGEITFETPEDFLKYTMNNPLAPLKERVAAAKALQPKGDAAKAPGKKASKAAGAQEAGKRFGFAAPQLVASNGSK